MTAVTVVSQIFAQLAPNGELVDEATKGMEAKSIELPTKSTKLPVKVSKLRGKSIEPHGRIPGADENPYRFRQFRSEFAMFRVRVTARHEVSAESRGVLPSAALFGG